MVWESDFQPLFKSSAERIQGNRQGTTISLPSFQEKKHLPAEPVTGCHQSSVNLQKKIALFYQKHSRILKKASENKYDSQPSLPAKLARPEPTCTQAAMDVFTVSSRATEVHMLWF